MTTVTLPANYAHEARIETLDGNVIPNATVVSSDPSVASVGPFDQSIGKVWVIGHAVGSCTFTASAPGYDLAPLEVTITEAVEPEPPTPIPGVITPVGEPVPQG